MYAKQFLKKPLKTLFISKISESNQETRTIHSLFSNKCGRVEPQKNGNKIWPNYQDREREACSFILVKG